MRFMDRWRAVALALALVWGGGRGAEAQTYHYFGCGNTFGTCASVTLVATPTGNGSYVVNGYMLNMAHLAPDPQYWNMMAYRVVSPTWDTWMYDGYSEFDCGGCNNWYDPETGEWQSELQVIYSNWTGALDPVCWHTPSCASQLRPDIWNYGPPAHPYPYPGQIEFTYIPGVVTFTFGSSGWDPWRPGDPILVSQGFGGSLDQSPWSAGEELTLTVGGEPPPVVTPEPVTMSLLATGLAGIGGAGVWKRRRRGGPAVS